jgi:hypothetical protein
VANLSSEPCPFRGGYARCRVQPSPRAYTRNYMSVSFCCCIDQGSDSPAIDSDFAHSQAFSRQRNPDAFRRTRHRYKAETPDAEAASKDRPDHGEGRSTLCPDGASFRPCERTTDVGQSGWRASTPWLSYLHERLRSNSHVSWHRLIIRVTTFNAVRSQSSNRSTYAYQTLKPLDIPLVGVAA